MKWETFYELFFKNLYFFIVLSFIYGLPLYILFKKKIVSILDPLVVILLNFLSSMIVISFLFRENLVKEKYLIQLILINLIFIFFLKLFLNLKEKTIFNKINKKFFIIFYKINSILFYLCIFLVLLLVNTKGFKSKLDAYNNIKVLFYMKSYLIPVQMILIILKRELYKIKNKKDIVSLIFSFIVFCLSGGKASIVTYILYIVATFYYISKIGNNRGYLNIKRNEVKITVLCIISLILFFTILAKNKSFFNVLKSIAFRIISNGDIYYMLYVDKILEKVKIHSLNQYYLKTLFNPVLKVIFGNILPRPLGFQIVEKIYGVTLANTGPNTKYDIIAQFNLGYFGGVISVIYAYIIARIRKLSSENFIMNIILILLFVNSMQLYVDFSLFSPFLFMILFFLPFQIIVTYLIYISSKKY